MAAGIIILDGPDGAGKTTLAKHICSKFTDSEYMHLGLPTTGKAWSEHKTTILAMIKHMRQGKLVIADRHFISEQIYGHVYRQGSECPFIARHIDRLLYRFGALRVICTPPVDYVLNTHKKLQSERYELYQDKMGLIAQMYLDLWLGRSLPTKDLVSYYHSLVSTSGTIDKIGWAHYDVTAEGQDLNKTTDRLICEMLDTKALLPHFYEDSDNHTGWARSSSVLLIGYEGVDSHVFPFLNNTGGSLQIAKTLNNYNADESRICMANANGHGSEKFLRMLSQSCGRTIALGRNVEQYLERHRIRYHSRVQHPQLPNTEYFENELHEALKGMAGVSI